MTLDELKQHIEQRAGVPAALLSGETAEENIAQAKALLAYKKEHTAQQPKSTAKQFADWIGGQIEESDRRKAECLGLQYTPPQTDPAGAALAEIEEQARLEAGGYPSTHDGGEVNLGDTRSDKEKFAEWIGQQLAFDPRKDGGGWRGRS